MAASPELFSNGYMQEVYLPGTQELIYPQGINPQVIRIGQHVAITFLSDRFIASRLMIYDSAGELVFQFMDNIIAKTICIDNNTLYYVDADLHQLVKVELPAMEFNIQ